MIDRFGYVAPLDKAGGEELKVYYYEHCLYNKRCDDRLYGGQFLLEEGGRNGQQELRSPNRKYRLIMEDGNVALWDVALWEQRTVIWETYTYNTGGIHPFTLKMEKDNNLVVYDSKSKVVWQSFTGFTSVKGKVDSMYETGKAVLQDDGNLVIYDKVGTELKRFGTCHKSGTC